MMKEIAKIKLSEIREHMKTNFRCHYFIIKHGEEREIEAVTSNWWCYPKKGIARSFPSSPEETVIVKKEID